MTQAVQRLEAKFLLSGDKRPRVMQTIKGYVGIRSFGLNIKKLSTTKQREERIFMEICLKLLT